MTDNNQKDKNQEALEQEENQVIEAPNIMVIESEIKSQVKRDKFRKFKQLYFLPFSIGLSFYLIILALNGVFKGDIEEKLLYKFLCDGAFAVGVVFIAVGLLKVSLREGIFSGLSFYASGFARQFIPGAGIKRQRMSVDAYKEHVDKRKNKKKTPIVNFLIIGAIFIIAAFIFMAVYDKIPYVEPPVDDAESYVTLFLSL